MLVEKVSDIFYSFISFPFFCRNDFKDYLLQSRLHFRIHSAQIEIRAKLKQSKKATSRKTSGQESVNGLDSMLALPSTEQEAIDMINPR